MDNLNFDKTKKFTATVFLVAITMLSPLSYAQNASIDWEYVDLDGLFVEGGKYNPIYLEHARQVMDGLISSTDEAYPSLDIPETWVIRHTYNNHDLNQYHELSGGELSIAENQIVMLVASRPLEDTLGGYTTPVQVYDVNGNNISSSNPLATTLMGRIKSIVLNSNDVWGDWLEFPIDTVAYEKSYTAKNIEPPLFILSSTLIHESFRQFWNPGNWNGLIEQNTAGDLIWTGDLANKHFHRGLLAIGLHPDFVEAQNLRVHESGHIINWIPIPDGRIRGELYQFSPEVSYEVSLMTNFGGGDGGITVMDALLLKDMEIELNSPERFTDPLPPTDISVLEMWRNAVDNIAVAVQKEGTVDAEVRDFLENRMGIPTTLSEDEVNELLSAMDDSFAKAIADAPVNNAPGNQLK